MKRVRHRKSKAAAPKRKNYGLSRVPHTHTHIHTDIHTLHAHTHLHVPDSSGHPFFVRGKSGQLLGKQLEDFSCWIRTCFTLVRVRACLCMCVCVCARLSKLTVTRSHLANFHVVNNASLCPVERGALGKILWISCSVCKLCNYNQFCAKLANKFWSNNCTLSLGHASTPTGQPSPAMVNQRPRQVSMN